MRIGLLHWAFPPVVGGVETHLEELGAVLARRGHIVEALVGTDGSSAPRSTHRGIGVSRHLLMRPAPASRHQVLDLLRRFVDQVRPDILHAHNMHYFSEGHAEALQELREETGIKLVLTAHNAWHDQLGTAFLRFAPIWDQIIAVSHYLRRTLLTQGYPENRTVVVQHGIDPSRWSSTVPGPDVPQRIFHPARLSLDKGSLVVVRALRRILQRVPDATLLLSGTGEIVDFESRQARELETVRREVEALGLSGHVELRAIPWQEMPAAYAESRVVVYPSRFDEPFGIAALEAMTSTRPVVVTSVGGMPEFVRDGRDGFVIASGDEQALADRVTDLLLCQNDAFHMGRQARRHAMRHFHVQQMVDKIQAVYESCLVPKRVPVNA